MDSIEQRREYWHGHIKAHSLSGLSVAQYCQQNGLKENRMHYWRKQLAEKFDAPPNWLPVQLADAGPEPDIPAGVSIRLAGGVRLELASGFDADTLRRAMAVLS